MIRLNDIYPTIQGEGATAGWPVVLIRLQGCGVGCPFCDTKETWKAHDRFKVPDIETLLAGDERGRPHWCEAKEEDIAHAARELAPNVFTAMITGGEPAEQDLTALNEALREQGFLPTIETSGTALGHVRCGWFWCCVSPKLGMPGGKPVLDEAVMLADEIKVVVGCQPDLWNHVAWIKRRQIMLKPGHIISLQPESQNPEATALCIKACFEEGWRLSIQSHKYIGVP